MAKIPETEKDQPAIFCNFCGKSQHEVKRMIVGEHDDRNPAICSEWIELARNIIIEEENKEGDPETDVWYSINARETHIKIDELVESLKSPLFVIASEAKQSIAYWYCLRLLRRFAPRNDCFGLFTGPSKLPVQILKI